VVALGWSPFSRLEIGKSRQMGMGHINTPAWHLETLSSHPHGMLTIDAHAINPDLLAFVEGLS